MAHGAPPPLSLIYLQGPKGENMPFLTLPFLNILKPNRIRVDDYITYPDPLLANIYSLLKCWSYKTVSPKTGKFCSVDLNGGELSITQLVDTAPGSFAEQRTKLIVGSAL